MSLFSSRPSTAIRNKVTFGSEDIRNNSRPRSAMVSYSSSQRSLISSTATLKPKRRIIPTGWMSEMDCRRQKLRGNFVHSRCSNVPNYADSVNEDLERNISVLRKATNAVAGYKGNPRYEIARKKPKPPSEVQQKFEFVHCVAPIHPLQRTSTPCQTTRHNRRKKSNKSEQLQPWQQRPRTPVLQKEFKIKTDKHKTVKRYNTASARISQKSSTYHRPVKDYEPIPLNPETSLEDLSKDDKEIIEKDSLEENATSIESQYSLQGGGDGVESDKLKPYTNINSRTLSNQKNNSNLVDHHKTTTEVSSQTEISPQKDLSNAILISSVSSTNVIDNKSTTATTSPEESTFGLKQNDSTTQVDPASNQDSVSNHDSNESIHDNNRIQVQSPRKRDIRVKTKKIQETPLSATQGYFPIEDIRTMTYEVREPVEDVVKDDLEVIDLEQQPKVISQQPIGLEKKIPTFILKPVLTPPNTNNAKRKEDEIKSLEADKPIEDTQEEQEEILTSNVPHGKIQRKPHRMLEKPDPFSFDPLQPVDVVSIDSTLWKKRSSHFDVEKLLDDKETDEEMKKRINDEQNIIKMRKPWLQGKLAMFRDENRFELPVDLAKLEDMSPLNYLEIHCRVSQRRRTMYSVIFRKFDRDRDGILNYKEVIKSLQSLHNDNLTDENIASLFEMTGVSESTSIDSAQFIVLAAYSERLVTTKNESSSFHESTPLTDKHLVEEADFWGIKSKLDTSNANLPLRRLLESV